MFRCFVIFLILNLSFVLSTNNCTLSDVYGFSNTREVVYDKLNDFFKFQFEKAIEEASKQSNYLVPPAKHFIREIRKTFIEEGTPLDSVQDLELILKSLNYLNFKNFRQIKLEHDV